MSTSDSRGGDTSPQRPLAADGSAGPPQPPSVESLPPQPPVVPQVPPHAANSTAIPDPQAPLPSVVPPHLVGADSVPVAVPVESTPPLAPVLPQVPGAGNLRRATSVPGTPTVPQPIPARQSTPPTTTESAAVQPVPHQPQNPQTVVTQAATSVSGDSTSEDDEPDLRETIRAWRQNVIDFVTGFALPNAPPWMVSMLVHLVVLVVLALIALPTIVESKYVVEVSYAEQLGEQLFDDSQYLEAIEPVEVDPALAFDPREVEDPLAASALPQFKLELPDSVTELDTPTIGLALKGRNPGSRKAMLAAYGGTSETEGAVEMALDWLKRNQQRDGTWRLDGPYSDGITGSGSGAQNRLAATAMALLAFQGAGNTHLSGEYKTNVAKGLEALLKMQDRDGSFFATQQLRNSHQLYSQAQATIVVCELFGMTEDSKLREPAQRAIDYAASIQASDRRGGAGWKYNPGDGVDTSVTGWFVIALKSGEMGDLSVPSPIKDKVRRFLDNVVAPPRDDERYVEGSRYLYKVGDKYHRVSMTAEALLCRQYLGWDKFNGSLLAGVRHLGENPIDWNEPNVYYWYYATQVMHHMGGDAWDGWNDVMRQAVPNQQVKTGREKGSWSPAGDQFGVSGGRLFMTCLCTYMLEVYYRHMPIYQY